MAIDSALNHFTIVGNGQKLEDKAFPIPDGALPPPTNLTGRLSLFKMNIGFWYSSSSKISNLNIFSRKMPLEEMVSRTAGEDCGKADGDYLAWESAEWILKGETSFGEVTVEDLCRRESNTQVFSSPFGGIEEIKNHCDKMEEGTLSTDVDRVNEVLMKPDGTPTTAGVVGLATWFPIRQTANSSWVDLYSKKPVEDMDWAEGYPDQETCALYVIPFGGLISYPCTVDITSSPIHGVCHFPVTPILILRGLCPDSHIDHFYQARNDPVTGYLYFYGERRTIVRFDGKKWKMMTAFYNTSGSTDAKPATFILGKHSWSISGDSEECHGGTAYTTKLKLSGCSEGHFTCDDGQCVKMEERCNQVPNCRDKSDEKGCQLIVFENNYNKNVPPIGITLEGETIPAQVWISITLMKVVEVRVYRIQYTVYIIQY